MMNNFPEVGIIKVVKMIMPMVDTLSRVGNLQTTMLMIMIFLKVRIFKVLMKIFVQVRIFKVSMKIFLQVKIFKALSRVMKNFPKAGILKAVKMIMPMVDTLS
jgi:hypothetical protein